MLLLPPRVIQARLDYERTKTWDVKHRRKPLSHAATDAVNIAVLSPRLEIRTVRGMDLGRTVSRFISRQFVGFVGTATWFNESANIDDRAK